MTLIRARQRAITAVSPHNANRSYIIPKRRKLASTRLLDINFRNTSSFVTDGEDATYCLNNDLWPVQRDNQGFGWIDQPAAGFDRNAGGDVRLAGVQNRNETLSAEVVFRVALRRTGLHEIRLALGDFGSSSWSGSTCSLLDDAAEFALALDGLQGFQNADNYRDALGGDHNGQAAWAANNQPVVHDFASQILNVSFKVAGAGTGSQRTPIAHLSYKAI